MHPRVGEQLVDIAEAPDVTNLGLELAAVDGPTPGIEQQPLCHLAVEQGCAGIRASALAICRGPADRAGTISKRISTGTCCSSSGAAT